MKYFSFFLLSFILTLFFGGCKKTTSKPVLKDIENIRIDNVPDHIYATRNSLQLKAVAHYNDGSEADVTEAAIWRFNDVNNYKEATVFYGLIVPRENGDGNGSDALLDINIAYKELADNAQLRIVRATAIAIDDTNISDPNNIKVDDNYTFAVDINYSDSTSAKADENHSNALIWSASGAAEIVSQSGYKAEVHFTRAGEANITLSFHSLNDLRTYNILDR